METDHTCNQDEKLTPANSNKLPPDLSRRQPLLCQLCLLLLCIGVLLENWCLVVFNTNDSSPKKYHGVVFMTLCLLQIFAFFYTRIGTVFSVVTQLTVAIGLFACAIYFTLFA